MVRHCLILSVLLLQLIFVHALPGFSNEHDQARYQQLTEQVRCLVCQNQSVADSQSQFAQTVRGHIAKRIVAGDSDRHIAQRLVQRYGEKILFSPRHALRTWLLWYGPYVLLLLVLFMWFCAVKRGGQRP